MSANEQSVMHALLALDSYNRHNRGELRKMSSKEGAQLDAQIGTATFQQSSDRLESSVPTLQHASGAGFSASSTVGVKVVHYPKLMSDSAVKNELHGEAVVADLGDGRYLFVLLGGQELMRGAYAAVEPAALRQSAKKTARGMLRVKEPLALPRKLWPVMMTFTDISDPASVREVDPEDLSATFGAGYALSAVTVQVTRDPVTKGEMEKVLGWLGEHRGKRLDGNRFGTITATNRIANSLSSGSFCTGCK